MLFGLPIVFDYSSGSPGSPGISLFQLHTFGDIIVGYGLRNTILGVL